MRVRVPLYVSECVRVCVFKCVSENEYVIASVTMRLQMRVSKYKINLLVVVCVSMCWNLSDCV